MSGGVGGERSSLEKAWSGVARAVNGELIPGFASGPRVQKAVGDWILTLDHGRTESGVPRTTLRAPYRSSDPFRFEMRDVRVVDDLLETLGFLQDITVGDAEIDRRFVIRGTSWARVRGLFVEPRVREILRAQPSVHLRTMRSPSYGPPFVSGLWELHFGERGAIVDVERLTGLFELFGLLLPRLCPEGLGYEGDVERLIHRLLGPAGAVTDPTGRITVWDGNTPRRDAAERLGRLGDARAVGPLVSVLGEPDDELVARAVEALGALGEADAVGPLVRLLGQTRRATPSGVLSGLAGAALAGLGRDDLPSAFRDALDGDPRSLGSVGHRAEIVAALLEVLDSADFTAAAHAARALGFLGAREAVPLLRARSRGWGMKTTLTEACAEALDEIEARAALPRPAEPGAPGDGSTLPRPAGDSDTSSPHTLPRSVDGEDEPP